MNDSYAIQIISELQNIARELKNITAALSRISNK